MKKILSVAFALLLVGVMSSYVQAAEVIPVPGTTLSFTSDSGTQWNGRWATAYLTGYDYMKQVAACVGDCTYSRVASRDEWRAYVKDVGSYFASAKAYYSY